LHPCTGVASSAPATSTSARETFPPIVGIVRTMADATAALEELREERNRAASRVSSLEAEWRTAQASVASASAALAEIERHGGSASGRSKAEEALAEAKATAAQPWSERVDGARRAVRDRDSAIRAFVGANLVALVASIEADGELAAQRLNQAVADLLSAAAEWQAAESRLAQTINVVARPSPGDVSHPRAGEVVRVVTALASAGGEEGPRVDRFRGPWDRLLGAAEPETEAVA
jgi:hypothetical protein